MNLKLLAIAALGVSVVAAASAVAAANTSTSTSLVTVTETTSGNYSFSETGFSGGASVTGTFSGVETTGQLSSFSGNISAFSMSFSGNTAVAAFTADFSDLYGLIYDDNGGPLGDGTTGYGEGVLVVTADGYSWEVGAILSGACTGSNVCGEISYDPPPPPPDGGSSPTNLGAVPEPASWSLLILGLSGLGASLRASRGGISQAA